MKEEYITAINNLLQSADLELLDLIFQLLQKSVISEKFPQSA